VLRREETIQRASGALDVLEKCRIVDTLDDALDGMTHLCATAMSAHATLGHPPREHRAHAALRRHPARRTEQAGGWPFCLARSALACATKMSTAATWP